MLFLFFFFFAFAVPDPGSFNNSVADQQVSNWSFRQFNCAHIAFTQHTAESCVVLFLSFFQLSYLLCSSGCSGDCRSS